jgi:Helix-turn-helix.
MTKYTLQNKVKEILKDRGLLQKDLVSLTGISQTQIQRICSNQTNSINKAHLTAIARATNVTDMNELFELVELKEQDNLKWNVSHETLKRMI